MGFFSKVFKSVGKVFKKIGKGIKSAFKKFGKFMNKIGILGQVAMFFIMPYVGAALGGMWTGIAGQTAAQTAATAAANTAAVTAGQAAGATAGQVAAGKVAEAAIASAAKAGIVAGKATGLMARGAVAQTVGKVMQFTANTVSKGFNVYSNITKGVTDTLGNFAKTASNNMFGTTFDAASNFFGAGDSAFSRSFGGDSRFQNLTGSETLFETSKQKRIAETEAKLNTSAGQKAIDKTVTEGYGNDGMGFGSDYANNIQKSIDMGDSNLTASLDSNYVPDPQALRLETAPIDSTSLLSETAATDIVRENLGVTPLGESTLMQPSLEYGQVGPTGVLDGIAASPELAVNKIKLPSLDYNVATDVKFDPYSQENFARGVLDDAGNMVGTANPDAVYQPSLMERLRTGISEAPANIYKKAGEIADDPLGFAFKGTEESLQKQINLRVGQELGISAKPEYIQNYVSNNAYVPSFESFGGSQQQYGAPEIMNARAFEQQVTNNPNPYGYTAFQYGNYMAQSAQTA